MKKFIDIMEDILAIIVIICFIVFLFICFGLNWIIEKVFKKKDLIPIDKWLDKLFGDDENEQFLY